MNIPLDTTGVETPANGQPSAGQAKTISQSNGPSPKPAGPTGPVWDRAKRERNWLVYRLEAKTNGKPGKMNKLPVDAGTGRQVGKDAAAKLTFG